MCVRVLACASREAKFGEVHVLYAHFYRGDDDVEILFIMFFFWRFGYLVELYCIYKKSFLEHVLNQFVGRSFNLGQVSLFLFCFL